MKAAILSLHDVMPETFQQVEQVVAIIKELGIPPFTLLVVPGREWNAGQLQRLRALEAEGFELAAHGWVHDSGKPRRLYHRLHGVLLSRTVAEHLALNPSQVSDLMQRSFDWFGQHDFSPPSLYVPPAWALGRISRNQLRELPYERIEVLKGFILPHSGRTRLLPMVGFEADNRFRLTAVRTWNRIQRVLARVSSRPLRIGLHPHDFQLPLADSLRGFLRQPFVWQPSREAPFPPDAAS